MFRLSILSAVFLASSAMAAPQNFAIDSLHSYPNFAVNHLGMSTMQGRFDKMTGRVVLDEAAKTGSIDLKIATASISTGATSRWLANATNQPPQQPQNLGERG